MFAESGVVVKTQEINMCLQINEERSMTSGLKFDLRKIRKTGKINNLLISNMRRFSREDSGKYPFINSLFTHTGYKVRCNIGILFLFHNR